MFVPDSFDLLYL